MTSTALAPRSTSVVVAAALSTVSCVFPGLASGALAVQASKDFGVSEGSYGWALGSFFLAAALTSVPLGRLAQRLGPRRQITIGLLVTAATQLLIATAVSSFSAMLAALAVAGMANSGVQTAVNLALSQAELPRLGLAVATKQSAMPASAMLGGLAVPAVALTIGWRWAYAIGACLALVSCALVWMVVRDQFVGRGPGPGPTGGPKPGRRESSSSALIGIMIASMCLAFSSGAINAWTVSSGVDAGLADGVAGLMLSLAAGSGIVVRLVSGARVDSSSRPPLQLAAAVTIFGVFGFALMAIRMPAVHAVATLLAFGCGWIWPVFTNFAIVNANPTSAGAATGISQTGVYLGVFSAPVLTGLVIDWQGYSTMWMLVAGVGVLGVLVSLAVSPQFPR